MDSNKGRGYQPTGQDAAASGKNKGNKASNNNAAQQQQQNQLFGDNSYNPFSKQIF
jgi:hypothetical protein